MAVGLLIIISLIIYAVVLRRNIKDKEEHKNFFREE
jgi:hypothetical protein